MNIFKKLFLISTSLLYIVDEVWAMEDFLRRDFLRKYEREQSKEIPRKKTSQYQEEYKYFKVKTQASEKEDFSQAYYIIELEDLYYRDDDISEYIESFLKENKNFNYFMNFKYLLSTKKNELTPIIDQEDGNDYIVAITPAINTASIDHFVAKGNVSSTNLGYFLDKSSHPKDKRETILEELVSYKPILEENSYGDLIQKIEDLKKSNFKLEFINELLEGQEENIENIRIIFEEELSKIRMEKKDVFDELMPFFLQAEIGRCKILFPYNQFQFHWLTGEINIHKEENQYKIKIYAHDPYGGGKMESSSFYELQDIIEKRVREYQPTSQFLSFKNKKSTYTPRQAKRDVVSCGVIAAEDLIRRITGTLEGLYNPVGALALRCSHLKTVEENNPELDFINRNKSKIYFINQYKHQEKNLSTSTCLDCCDLM